MAEEAGTEAEAGIHYCYILRSKQPGNKASYNGYTNNLGRRIRQHCCEIKGGAKATTRHAPGWEYIAQITSTDPLFTKQMALSLEWYIRYPTRQRPRPSRYNGPRGRLEALELVFALEKFQDIPFIVAVIPEYEHILAAIRLPSNITITTQTN